MRCWAQQFKAQAGFRRQVSDWYSRLRRPRSTRRQWRCSSMIGHWKISSCWQLWIVCSFAAHPFSLDLYDIWQRVIGLESYSIPESQAESGLTSTCSILFINRFSLHILATVQPIHWVVQLVHQESTNFDLVWCVFIYEPDRRLITEMCSYITSFKMNPNQHGRSTFSSTAHQQ